MLCVQKFYGRPRSGANFRVAIPLPSWRMTLWLGAPGACGMLVPRGKHEVERLSFHPAVGGTSAGRFVASGFLPAAAECAADSATTGCFRNGFEDGGDAGDSLHWIRGAR